MIKLIPQRVDLVGTISTMQRSSLSNDTWGVELFQFMLFLQHLISFDTYLNTADSFILSILFYLTLLWFYKTYISKSSFSAKRQEV